jgi:hypothetical protein
MNLRHTKLDFFLFHFLSYGLKSFSNFKFSYPLRYFLYFNILCGRHTYL